MSFSWCACKFHVFYVAVRAAAAADLGPPHPMLTPGQFISQITKKEDEAGVGDGVFLPKISRIERIPIRRVIKGECGNHLFEYFKFCQYGELMTSSVVAIDHFAMWSYIR